MGCLSVRIFGTSDPHKIGSVSGRSITQVHTSIRVNELAGGNEYAFHGLYHEISSQRLVQTFEFEGMPGHVLLEIMHVRRH
jgi:hypothetical protein